MNRDKNSYTIIYAIVMVVIVAVGLAFTAQALKAPQEENKQIDKMQQILRSVRVDASDKGKVKQQFETLIREVLLVDTAGSITARFGKDKLVDNEAFKANTANDFKEIAAGKVKPLPVYVANIDGKTKYIFPMNGAGLWGPIWGYISVDKDCNTVYAADFSHQGETPGLGAEIVSPSFSNQFRGKKLTHDGQFMSIAVVKPGRKPDRAGQDYVDGISGGTLTSNGVNDMLYHSLAPFARFLEKQRKEDCNAQSIVMPDSVNRGSTAMSSVENVDSVKRTNN